MCRLVEAHLPHVRFCLSRRTRLSFAQSADGSSFRRRGVRSRARRTDRPLEDRSERVEDVGTLAARNIVPDGRRREPVGHAPLTPYPRPAVPGRDVSGLEPNASEILIVHRVADTEPPVLLRTPPRGPRPTRADRGPPARSAAPVGAFNRAKLAGAAAARCASASRSGPLDLTAVDRLEPGAVTHSIGPRPFWMMNGLEVDRVAHPVPRHKCRGQRHTRPRPKRRALTSTSPRSSAAPGA